MNSDPSDGGSRGDSITALLNHPRVATFDAPQSTSAVRAATSQAGANAKHTGDPALDTADFNDRSVGNLRVDYVLPSANFRMTASGVFWPDPTAVPPDLRQAVQSCLAASDHHLVWVDVKNRTH